MPDHAASGPAEPIPISAPPDFPVVWNTPEEERLPWEQDRMHFPNPLTALEGEFWCRFMNGLNQAFQAYELPNQVRARRINTYYYHAITPSAPLEEMEARGKRAEKNLEATIGRLAERWNTEWLPEIQAFLAHCDAFDLKAAETPDLMAHLDDVLERSNRIWGIHFQTVMPVFVAMGLFDDLYCDLFGSGETFDSYRLLQGFDNKTLETNRALWALGRKARARAEVRRVLENSAASEVLTALETSADGRAFLGELRAFLDAYGQRGATWGIAGPSWIEDPAPVIQNLKDYISREEGDPKAEMESLAAERKQAEAEARERLKGYPAQVTGQFEFLLKASQLGISLTEDHGFWIDFNATHRLRRILMEVGGRLAEAGTIEAPEDIFHLTLDEIRASAVASPPDDRRGLVADRRAELERFGAVTPPPRLGMDYGPPPDTPLTRAFGKFWGGPPQPQVEADILKGNAGSPGKVTGTARVIRSLDEADRLALGDILVAETTAPPWTPLFATAGGIVTDTGGILSHCAVVAREYRIPAVVGVGAATSTIRDGQVLEVDGNAGVVRIVG